MMKRSLKHGLVLLLGLIPAISQANTSPTKRLAGLDNPKHIHCAREAARAFHVPFAGILILLDVERGWEGAEQPNRNADGEVVSYDLGPMQINDRAWGSTFADLGISREQLRDDACINIHAGSWIYGRHLHDVRRELAQLTPEERAVRDPAEVEAVLRYHSRTPKYQERYREHVRNAVIRGLQAVAQR